MSWFRMNRCRVKNFQDKLSIKAKFGEVRLWRQDGSWITQTLEARLWVGED